MTGGSAAAVVESMGAAAPLSDAGVEEGLAVGDAVPVALLIADAVADVAADSVGATAPGALALGGWLALPVPGVGVGAEVGTGVCGAGGDGVGAGVGCGVAAGVGGGVAGAATLAMSTVCPDLAEPASV